MQYQAGIDLVWFGLLSMILMMLTIFSAVKAGQSISFQWKKAYFQAAVKKSITWHDFNEDFTETIENDCENIQKIFEKNGFFIICYMLLCNLLGLCNFNQYRAEYFYDVSDTSSAFTSVFDRLISNKMK